MPKIYKIRRKSLVLVVPALLVLTLVMAGCGSSSSSGSGNSGTDTGASTPSPTVTKGTASTQGCPNNVILSPAQGAPTITVTQGESQKPVAAHQGDIIEVQLAANHRWTGPTTSQGNLELQTPYGYVSQNKNMCVWRFVAKSAGTTNLNFEGHPICQKGQMCPQYILSLPFSIVVK